MQVVDIVIVVLVLLSTFAGFRSGVIRCIFSLLGLIAGIIFASRNYEQFAREWSPQMQDRGLADAMWFCILAVIVMLLAALLGWLIRGAVKLVGLEFLDRVAGLVFGFLRGAVLVSLCISTLAAFYPTSGWVSGSQLAHYFFGVTRVATRMTPDELRDKILQGLRVMETDAAAWLKAR